jgi:hypothetical protein
MHTAHSQSPPPARLDGAALLDVVLPKSTVLFERLASQREVQVVALSRKGYTGC